MPVTAVFVLYTPSTATPENWEIFKATYGVKDGSRIMNSQCRTCHTEPPTHNLFGKDVKAAAKLNKGLVTALSLHAIDTKDSDGDGWSNGEEIRQDFMPGDGQSHPSGTPPVAGSANKPLSFLDGWVPRHSFHPVVVHFPIALFLFGAALEFFGWRRKREAIRQAGWLCVLFGTLSTLIAVPTGILVFLRSGYRWEGTALIHFILATAATLLMTATVLWRRKTAHESYAYFVLLFLAASLVGVAGHFGGQLVYGN